MFDDSYYQDADDRIKELEEKGYHFDVDHNVKNLPKSSNIHDYYERSDFKDGRKFREDMFFNLLEPEQHTYARKKQEWLREFKDRGFDVNDPEVQDICDYHAGQYIINWLNNLSEQSVKKHYYYRNYKFKKYLNYDLNDVENWSDFDISVDEFFDDGGFFDDFFDF